MERESNILRRISENKQRSFIVLEDAEDGVMDAFSKPRKRRLDHLSWEEKVQRKKLKNRVAAQTSRDRKKARMEQLEDNFDKLMAQNELVLAECESLKRVNEALRAENAELRLALSGGGHQHRRAECDGGHLSGSTESENLLLQQGVAPHSAAASTRPPSPQPLLALKILLACLLCRTSSTSSTKTSILAAWTSSPRACSQISPAILMRWVMMLNRNNRLVNAVSLEKWWGRHQSNWNPIEMAAA